MADGGGAPVMLFLIPTVLALLFLPAFALASFCVYAAGQLARPRV